MKSLHIFISLSLALFYIIVYVGLDINPTYDILKCVGIIGFCQLFSQLYGWKRVTGTVFVPFIVFLIAAYLFTFGQSFLYVFDAVSDERNLLNQFTYKEIFDAQIITLLFLNLFYLGGLYGVSKVDNKRFIKVESEVSYKQINAIKKVGTLFIIISVIPYIIDTISTITIASTLGYGGIYEQQAKVGFANIINILSQYFIPGIICLLLVESRKSRTILYVLILILNIILFLYIGGRSNGVVLASILLMWYHLLIKPLRLKQFIIICSLGYVFSIFLVVVAETRTHSNVSLYESVINYNTDKNPIAETVSEMGGSMFPLIETQKIVEENPNEIRYGSSYLYSLTSVIPNMGFWSLHPAMKYGNLNDWLQKELHLNYGPGFSIVAEAFINLKVFGFILMFILGYFFSKLMNHKIYDYRNPLFIVIAFLFCYLTIKTVRNSFLATVRSVFYYIIPIYLIVVYYYKVKINK